MNIISGIGESGFLAHSAFSAGIATKDSNGNDITATYLTGVDLTQYQTVEGMTAYQSAGEYYSASNPSGFLVADDITGKLDASVYAADSGSFLTAVPDTYLQNTDLTISDGKITEISGVPLSAGDELPSGTMNTSALEFNAVNEISGYNGSAIAQYGAEKQWLVHDDTLVHASNSAQYALGVNLSAVAQLLGVDETVLYEGSAAKGTIIQLNDSISAFNKITLTLDTNDGNCFFSNYFNPNLCSANNWTCTIGLNDSYSRYNKSYRVNFSGNSACLTGSYEKDLASTSSGSTALSGYIREIRGIGRKEV